MTARFNTQALYARIRSAAERGLVAATEEVRTEAISLILDTPKTGRIYRRRGVYHQASAPGEPPASDTGRLVKSIRTEFDFDRLVGRVIASTKYAALLETGTSRMAARPFMRPALANKRDAITARLNEAVGAELRGAR